MAKNDPRQLAAPHPASNRAVYQTLPHSRSTGAVPRPRTYVRAPRVLTWCRVPNTMHTRHD
jgi:hypothetical protein